MIEHICGCGIRLHGETYEAIAKKTAPKKCRELGGCYAEQEYENSDIYLPLAPVCGNCIMFSVVYTSTKGGT